MIDTLIDSDTVVVCASCVGHARKAVSIQSSVNYLPSGAEQGLGVDETRSDSSSDSEDSDFEIRVDPTLLEDKELGFHVT